MFQINYGKGFKLTFPNGYTVSVQFGFGNYCDNYSNTAINFNKIPNHCQSNNAEIAYYNKVSNLLPLEEFNPEWTDTVKGYVSVTEVMTFLNWVQSLPNASK